MYRFLHVALVQRYSHYVSAILVLLVRIKHADRVEERSAVAKQVYGTVQRALYSCEVCRHCTSVGQLEAVTAVVQPTALCVVLCTVLRRLPTE